MSVEERCPFTVVIQACFTGDPVLLLYFVLSYVNFPSCLLFTCKYTIFFRIATNYYHFLIIKGINPQKFRKSSQLRSILPMYIISFWAMRNGTVFRNIQHKNIDIMTEDENVSRSISITC